MKVEIRSKRFPVRNLENELCLKSWHQVHYIIFHLSFKEQNDVHTIFKMTAFSWSLRDISIFKKIYSERLRDKFLHQNTYM